MHIFINALGASAGAGLTYLRNVIPQFARVPGLTITLAAQSGVKLNFEAFENVDVLSPAGRVNVARRFWFEQRELAACIKKTKADVLLSTGNFAVRRSPIPQILLSGNSLYVSSDFYRDLKFRRNYSILVNTLIRGFVAKRSVAWADCTVAPSEAFAQDLHRWTGREISVVHHGFDRETFFCAGKRLPNEVEEKLRKTEGSLRLLFVSHYNYYRNFETLLRSLPLIQEQLPNLKVKLFLTCKLEPGKNPGTYDPTFAARLIRELGIREMVEELGAIPYDCLQYLYRACDLYVTAAYTETFAHPLVEAMASGLPVIASDLGVHREVCEDAALYFPPFECGVLAKRVVTIAARPDVRSRLVQAGAGRSGAFSWSQHVSDLLKIAEQLCRAPAFEKIPTPVISKTISGETPANGTLARLRSEAPLPARHRPY